MITILGPTATGKTTLAAKVALFYDGEIISADSRQVYRGMNLGTGKDYEDYSIDGKKIPYHLIDITDPGNEYNVFEFQNDFLRVFDEISRRGKLPVLCGGTGMYLEAVLAGYRLRQVPENSKLRDSLSGKSINELNSILQSYRDVHNITDGKDRGRAIRAIEIAEFQKEYPPNDVPFPVIDHKIFGIHFERQEIRERITRRLKQRLQSGMIEEIESLLASGIKPEQLTFYGLEYRYLTDFVTSKISYEEMFSKLNTAIHQFAKRQMTWFRRMEKRGFEINWIDGNLELEEKLEKVREVLGIIEGRN